MISEPKAPKYLAGISAGFLVLVLAFGVGLSLADSPEEASAPPPTSSQQITTTTIDIGELEAQRLWNSTALWNATEWWGAYTAWNANTTTSTTASPPPVTLAPPLVVELPPDTNWPVSLQPCGGDLPPCWRVQIESGGDYNAVNWGGCNGHNCYGKYQFAGDWACKLGLPCDLLTATPEQQDNAARLLWDGGNGCSHWHAC